MTKEPQIKGTAIRGIVAAIDRICPPGTRKKVIALLPDQVAPAVEHESFLAAGWYPLAHMRSIFGAAMQATGRDLELVRELAAKPRATTSAASIACSRSCSRPRA